VVGVIGVMQALEVIKIIVRDSNKSMGGQDTADWRPSMTMFAAFDTPQWRSFRLRPRKATCIACGDNPSITRETIHEGDYEKLCMRIVPTEIVERVSVTVPFYSLDLIIGIFKLERGRSCPY
jgi:adenylyltransferase and sulfurtransferase